MLEGKRILIVEDEPGVARNLQAMLVELQCEPAGTATTLDAALPIALSSKLDAAVLDINMGGSDSVVIAKALQMRSIPFLLATGFAHGRSSQFGDAPVLEKPYDREELGAALSRLFN